MKKLELLKAKAELFNQLAVMESAGMPLQQSIQSQVMGENQQLNDILSHVLAELKAGKSFAIAGASAGLFTDIDKMMVQAATDSGKLEQMLKTLAEQYELRYGLAREMKAKMFMPVMVFVLAVFIAPISSLVAGTIDAGGYINATVFFLLKIALFCYVMMKLPGLLKDGALSGLGLSDMIDSLLLKLPVFGTVCIKHELTKFFENLGLLLHAGIPLFDAMPKSVDTLGNRKIKKSFKTAIMKLKNQSATLTDSLIGNEYIADESIQFVRTGEQAGKLDESLMHYSKIAREQVTSSMQQIAAWIPRIIYGIICIYMIHSIFASNAFAPPQIEGLDTP